jgi:hypothetical protein
MELVAFPNPSGTNITSSRMPPIASGHETKLGGLTVGPVTLMFSEQLLKSSIKILSARALPEQHKDTKTPAKKMNLPVIFSPLSASRGQSLFF